MLLGEAKVVEIVELDACMRDVWVGCVAAPRAALGKPVPSFVNMCCLPRGQGGKLGASARSGCREALGLAPGLCAWPLSSSDRDCLAFASW